MGLPAERFGIKTGRVGVAHLTREDAAEKSTIRVTANVRGRALGRAGYACQPVRAQPPRSGWQLNPVITPRWARTLPRYWQS